jgi:hypothetical protein
VDSTLSYGHYKGYNLPVQYRSKVCNTVSSDVPKILFYVSTTVL